MEEQLVSILAQTQQSSEGPRKQAEAQLQQLYSNPAYPLSLVGIASHDSVPVAIRQSALLNLKTFVLASWSPQFDEFKGQILVDHENKARLRSQLLDLATSGSDDRKIKGAASYVVSKIATADFPDEWPDLLPTLLRLIPNANDGQLHGALKVLVDIVDESLSDAQFFQVATDVVKVIYGVVADDTKKTTLRALAVSVLRSIFDSLEIYMEDHKVAVKAFAEEVTSAWLPFFLNIMKSRLPTPPSEEEEQSETAVFDTFRGLVALKLQVVKCLMRIRSIFPSTLAPHSVDLFSATWEELTSLQSAYYQMYIEDERQSRLEDADGLPYTLDFLVLEELDFMQACLKAGPVKKQLEQQLQGSADLSSSWVTEVMKLATAYAQITTEEEGLWNVDVNIFLSEETSVTANYTPRTACGDLVIKLGEWLTVSTVDGLLSYTRSLYSADQPWKAKEAALYVTSQLLSDYSDSNKLISAEAATGFVDFIKYAMQQEDEFLRARGYLVAGIITRTSGEALLQVAPSFLEATVNAVNGDSSEVVRVSCIRTIQHYLSAIPRNITTPLQNTMITSVTTYLQGQDLQELADSDDLMVTLVETLRDIIYLNIQICFTGNGMDLLFKIASHGANNFQLTSIVLETFEEITTQTSSMGHQPYISLCEKVLPSLTGAFDVGSLTEESALVNLAADLLSLLAQHGSEPLPNGFVGTVMPRLNRFLLGSTDEELLRSSTSAVKNILVHDYKQLFEWRDESGKGGLEVVLVIIDRLLSPNINDNAAAEVGALAAEVVEKAGSERLGPFLEQLLRAVAIRLGSATEIAFIQSLTLVFARLSLVNAKEVVDFLSQVQVQGAHGPENGLQIVMAKWLENSVHFAGYDEIRQNVIALSKLYDLADERLAQVTVKGDLVVPQSDRIMTRSRARQNPDQYTSVSATLKILKVLVEELLSASGLHQINEALAQAAEASDDDEWEDDPGVLDLGLGSTKQELMAFDNENYATRQRDDDTQAYLLQFFQAAATKPGFEQMFSSLTPQEQEKLRQMGA